MKRISTKLTMQIGVFSLLLILSNLYLLKPGFWFFQDAGYWPKTSQEAWMMLSQQFHVFTNFGYSLGFDQGLFSFTRIVVEGFIFLFFHLFGYGGSQLAFAISGYILTFISFYLFSGIFFANKTQRYILAILYTFNPFSYTLQGAVFFNAISPLFIYTYHKYFYEKKDIRIVYLLLNIFSGYLLVSYIRFFQSNLIILLPYSIYLFCINKGKLRANKIILYVISYLLIFSPILYSFTAQILEKSQTAFNYGNVFGKFVVTHPFFNAFNFFQSVAPRFYEGKEWSILGLLFFLFILYLVITFPKRQHSGLYFLNFGLILSGITFYALANIFGESGYHILIRLFPFVINEPFWGFYVLALPLVVFIGILTQERLSHLVVYTALFVLFSILPLLNLSDFQLQKFNLSHIPKPYYDYFIKPTNKMPEATYFPGGNCWRTKLMNETNNPTFCLNYGLRYVSILLDDPRLASGKTLDLASKMNEGISIDNLRITHNLKSIIIPNDIVEKKGPGPNTGKKALLQVERVKANLARNPLLSLSRNKNFDHFYYRDRDLYDFFIYAPKKILSTSIRGLSDNNLTIYDRPILLQSTIPVFSSKGQDVHIAYKVSLSDPTLYYIRISRPDTAKGFSLQMNQAYANSWGIKWIDKKKFDAVTCQSAWESFVVTNNQRCRYHSGLINPNIITLSQKTSVSLKKHTIGNLLSNYWLITPNDIPPVLRKDHDLYAVILYNKQTYFSLTILLAGFVAVTLFIVCGIQEIWIIVKRRGKYL